MSGDIGPVLVTGASGTTGSAVLRALGNGRVDVRAMVRHPGRVGHLPAGVRPVVADFDDIASLDTALAGVRRAYLVTPSSERAERQQLDFVERASAAGVQQLALLSQLGAAADSPVRFLRYHAAIETRIRALGLGFTFLRPNLFFQGTLAFAGQVVATDAFSAPIGDAAVSAVDTRDIGDVAAAVLLDERHLGATYTLTGPAALTHARIAEALGDATGRPIRFSDTTPDRFAAAITGVLPPWQVDGLLEDYAHYRRGEAAAVTGAVREVTGHPPRSVDDFARDHAATFTRTEPSP